MHRVSPAVFILLLSIVAGPARTQQSGEDPADARVKSFLAKMRYQWRDMNVPEQDGKLLFDLVLKNRFKKALEIGTSTGHSSIWIAWALRKTGGKLITVEIDPGRHREALANFREAGVSDLIDARLADAHTLVPELPGPFDFVFIDADKDWYTNYAKAVIPKLEAGGCIAAHNVYVSGRGPWGGSRRGGTAEYYDYMRSLPDFESSLLQDSPAGLAVSCRKRR